MHAHLYTNKRKMFFCFILDFMLLVYRLSFIFDLSPPPQLTQLPVNTNRNRSIIRNISLSQKLTTHFFKILIRADVFPQLLGYSVVASSSTPVKQDYNEYMWTMRRDFPGQQFSPDSASVVERDNISNTGREASSTTKTKSDA